MPETAAFPAWKYPAGGRTEPDYGGRVFNSQAELDAAKGEGPWFDTPQQAQAAGAEGTPEEGEGETPARRSHHRQGA